MVATVCNAYFSLFHDGRDEVDPQISADLEGIDDEQILLLELHRTDGAFGFSIRGGAEYNSHLFVLRIAEGGAADRDGLQVYIHVYYQVHVLYCIVFYTCCIHVCNIV